MTRSREPEALAATIAAPTPTPQHSASGPVGSGDRASGAPDEGLPPGDILGDRYRIVELVGRGGQGDVYRAEDLEVKGHVVALKLLHHAARDEVGREHAMRELRMLAAVSHPSIVQFKDSGWYGGRLFFVMPWLQGGTLEQLGRISRAEARRIFESVAAGVAALHAKGMRHQDIKPSNIFLARIDGFDDSMPVLLDLGVAASEGDALVAGSPNYFAPEVAASWPTGGGEIGPSADVYALALTLRNALDPDGAPEIDVFSKADLEARATVPVPPPAGREVAYLRPCFERWLAIDPERRPTAEALMGELAILTEPEDRRRDRAKTLRRVAPYAGVLAVVLAVAGWWANGELLAREKAAMRAADEQRAAEALAAEATEDAQSARDAERNALARAASSAQQADQLETEARSAMARVRAAQRLLGRAEGDRSRLEEAAEELQSALEAAERARESERQARVAERAESERLLRLSRETHAREQSELIAQRDRAQTALGEAETRARQSEARGTEAEARAQAAEARAQAAEARVRSEGAVAQTEDARVEAAEARAQTAESRAQTAEARAAELERRLAELEGRLRRLEREGAGVGRPRDPSSPVVAPVVVAPAPVPPPVVDRPAVIVAPPPPR